MEKTIKPWDVKDKAPVTGDHGERPLEGRRDLAKNIGDRSLREEFLQSLEPSVYKWSPQQNRITVPSKRPIPSKHLQREINGLKSSSSSNLSRAGSSQATIGSQSLVTPSALPRSLDSPRLSSNYVGNASTSIGNMPSPNPVDVMEGGRSSPPPAYEVTEWTTFVDRIQGHPSSATYEDLLLLEEVNGPAPSSRGVGYRVSNQELNVSVGPIELLRRRTTKEGKAKLKLTLVGLRVERCGICLTQFKSGEHGALTDCCHSFHEGCLQKWVVQVASCPICRLSLIPA